VVDKRNAAPGQISVFNLRLDPTEWTLAEENPNENVFVSKAGDVVGVELRTEATAFDLDFNDLATLRANIREGFGGAGLISADVEIYGSSSEAEMGIVTNTTPDLVPTAAPSTESTAAPTAVRGMAIITKLPQIPSGISYNGLIFLPFKDFSYSLYMRYEEEGMIGLRDSILLDRLIEQGEVTIGTPTMPAVVQGLAEDLYDATLRGPLVRSKAEREEYDKQFPDHPLSRLRSCMARIKQALIIDANVLAAGQHN
jgi:hypothetical protein